MNIYQIYVTAVLYETDYSVLNFKKIIFIDSTFYSLWSIGLPFKMPEEQLDSEDPALLKGLQWGKFGFLTHIFLSVWEGELATYRSQAYV